MKRSILVLISAIMVMTMSSSMCFAQSVDGIAADMVSSTEDTTAAITPQDNRHYTTVILGEWSNKKTFTISKAEAATEKKYEAALRLALKGLADKVLDKIGLGGALNDMIDHYYKGAYTANGTYTERSRVNKRVSVDRLTGKQALLESIYEFQTTFKGDTVTYTLTK